MEGAIREMVRQRGLQDRVHLTGIIKDIHRVYQDLDLLVLTSINEGTPVVIIQALAAGCPVASTVVGGVAEVLSSPVCGFPLRPAPRDMADDLLAAIHELPRREAEAGAWRERTRDAYSLDQLVRQVGNLYHELLARQGRHFGQGNS